MLSKHLKYLYSAPLIPLLLNNEFISKFLDKYSMLELQIKYGDSYFKPKVDSSKGRIK